MSDSRQTTVRLRAEVTDFKRQFDEASKAVDKTAASIDKNGQRIQTVAGRMVRSAEVNREAWTTAGTSITAFGVAGAAAMALSAKAAIDWETAWTGVLKTVEATPAQLQDIEDGLRGMALEIPKTATELAGIAEIAGQLGVESSGILTFTRTVADLSETTNLTAEDAATSLARIANIMGTSVSEVANMGATIVDLGNNAATKESEIVALGTRLAAAGRQAGLSEADVFAFASALTSVGVEAEAGGTALSKVFTSIGDAVRDGGEDLSTFARVAGESVEGFTTLFEQDAASAIGAFVEGMGRMAEQGQSTTAVFEDLELTDQRLMRAILSLGSAQGLLSDQLTIANDAWEDNSALVEEAEKRYDTTASKIQIAKNSLNEAAISIGETFLPAIAGLAEGATSITEAFAGLPAPVQNAIGSLGALAAAAGLAAGSFLLLFPRAMETVRALRDMGAISPRAADGLGKVGRAAGALGIATTAALALKEAIDAVNETQINQAGGVGQTTAALLRMASGAEDANSALAGLGLFDGGSGWVDALTGNTNDIHSLADAFEAATTAQSGFWDQLSSGFSGATVEQAQTVFEEIDQAMTHLAQSGATDEATRAMLALKNETGATFAELRELLPGYTDALADLENQQELTGEASGDLAVEQEQLAITAEEAAKAAEEAEEAYQDWRSSVVEAYESFINLGAAFDSVIEANREYAQSTADATEDASDSWSDYYDGVTVGKDQYIDALEEQVQAQLDWQSNMLAVAERVGDELPESMRGAGQQMIDELLGLGPEGAAQVALLADLSDEEFARVVELYGQKGGEAGDAFVSQLEIALGNMVPEINFKAPKVEIPDIPDIEIPDLQLNLSNLAAIAGSGQGYTDGGPISGPGSSTSDSVPIWASDGEYMQKAAAHQFWGTRTMDAMNNMDVGGLWRELGARGFRDGGAIGATAAPSVVTVPVESRYERHANVSVYSSPQSIDALIDDAERNGAFGGN